MNDLRDPAARSAPNGLSPAGRDPLAPEVADWVRDHFGRIAFNRHLGMEIVALGPGACDVRLPFRPQWAQQHGYFHGGVIGTLADSTAGHAAMTGLEPGRSALTVEFKLNFLAPAKGDALLARARVVKPGRRLIVIQTEVIAEPSESPFPCAIALVTYMAD